MTTSATEQRRARLTAASSVTITRQREIYTSRIPSGTVTLVAGYAGEGKSSWLIHVTALGSRGQLEGDLMGIPFPTIWVNIEDDPSRVQVPRLTAAGADLDKVMLLTIDSTVDEVTRETIPTLPLDIGAFRDALVESGAKMLVLDPASSLMAGDLNKREDARRSLDALSSLAQELDVAIVLVMHLAKGRGRASEKISGSHALRDAVRSVLLVAKDEETDQRIITVDKANYGPYTGKSWAFAMLDTLVSTPDGEQLQIGRVQDLGETEMTVDRIINRDPEEDEADDRNAAQAFILDYLHDCDGWEAAAGDVIKAGRAAGFNETEMKNARKRSKSPSVESRKASFGAGWVWGIGSEGVTKVSKVSGAQMPTPSTPSVTPSPVGPTVDEWEDPGCCRHGVTIGGRCKTCGGVASFGQTDTTDTFLEEVPA